jgi:hypothetical protein
MAPLRFRLHGVLTSALTPLVRRTPGEAQLDFCGPKTNDVAHVGHARAALTQAQPSRNARGLDVADIRLSARRPDGTGSRRARARDLLWRAEGA